MYVEDVDILMAVLSFEMVRDCGETYNLSIKACIPELKSAAHDVTMMLARALIPYRKYWSDSVPQLSQHAIDGVLSACVT